MVLSRLGNFDQLVIYTRYALLYINLEKNDFGHSEQRISMLFARLMFSLNTKKRILLQSLLFFYPTRGGMLPSSTVTKLAKLILTISSNAV